MKTTITLVDVEIGRAAELLSVLEKNGKTKDGYFPEPFEPIYPAKTVVEGTHFIDCTYPRLGGLHITLGEIRAPRTPSADPDCPDCKGTGKIRFKALSDYMPRWSPWEVKACACVKFREVISG